MSRSITSVELTGLELYYLLFNTSVFFPSAPINEMPRLSLHLISIFVSACFGWAVLKLAGKDINFTVTKVD